MLKVRNKRTGVEGTYPEKQARWLVSTGKCELVQDKPVKAEPKAKKGTYKTKDLKAEAQDVAIQPEAAEVTE